LDFNSHLLLQNQHFRLPDEKWAPFTTGFSTKRANAGDLENQGVELGLRPATPVCRAGITAGNTNVNFGLNVQRVTKLTVPSHATGLIWICYRVLNQIQEGKSATQIPGAEWNGGVKGVRGDAEPDFQVKHAIYTKSHSGIS
jgi:hypothetical protein